MKTAKQILTAYNDQPSDLSTFVSLEEMIDNAMEHALDQQRQKSITVVMELMNRPDTVCQAEYRVELKKQSPDYEHDDEVIYPFIELTDTGLKII